MCATTHHLAVCALLSITAFGCAAHTPKLAIQQWPIEQRTTSTANALPSRRLAVLPLVDQRPAHERQGQRAKVLVLLVWNYRKGDYYTGDATFGHDVAAQLSDRLAAYLNASQIPATLIRDVAPPPHAGAWEAAQVRMLAATETAEVVVTGALEHFFGSQHQDFSMWIAPLYFINAAGWQNGKSLPWGQSTATFAAYDGRTGAQLWQQQLQTHFTLPRQDDSMAQAAMESFAQLLYKRN